MTEQEHITYMNITKKISQQHMMKEFNLPGLHLLGLASNGLSLSIMLKSVKNCVYNAQMLLKLVPVSPEYSKMDI